MGVSASSELGPLAVAAVAEITRFDAAQVRILRQLLHDVVEPSDEQPGSELGSLANDANSLDRDALAPPRTTTPSRHEPNLSYMQFHQALEHADFFDSDVAIFDRMFTLLDRTGGEAIFALEFVVSICALLRGDLESKLRAAFEMLHEQPQMVSRDDVAFVLHTLTQAASYFGDPALVQKTTNGIADDVFAAKTTAATVCVLPESDSLRESSNEEADAARKPSELPRISSAPTAMSIPEVAARVAQHPLVEQYVRGESVSAHHTS